MVLDVDGILEFGLLPSQYEVLCYDTEWAGVRGGKGAGKSIGLCFWVLDRLQTYPEARHVVVGANYEQLRRGFMHSFGDVLKSIGWEEGTDYKYLSSPSPVYKLANGAILESVSARLEDLVNSLECQTLLLEEPQTWLEGEQFYGLITVRMRHSLGSAAAYGRDTVDADGNVVPALRPMGRLSFNPPAEGSWLHTLVEKTWKKYGYPCLRVSTSDNYLLLARDPGYVERVKMSTAPSRWAAEIDGHYPTAGGKLYREYDSAVHAAPPPGIDLKVDMTQPLRWFHDFNVAKMCSTITQVKEQPILAAANAPDRPIPGWQRRVLRVLGELVKKDAGAEDVVAEFVEKWGAVARVTGVRLGGDFSGSNRNQAVSAASEVRTNYMAIEKGLREAGIPFVNVVPTDGNGPVVDRINYVNAQFKTGEGFGVVLDPENTPVLVKDLVEVVPGKDGGPEKKNPELTHMSDAFGYDVVDLRDAAPVFAFYG